ncbi:hypothetical protein DQ237_10370 [Blastococcus sp. TF02-8]|uniref:O-antigen ligase family protein n=1 Tax=Blastococcus sp. TF02-8 TaxID=2250574 RepID=UPI000DE98768|nr:O-antigen ligase family protein [Blastococcus sp. TF02-8]RBY96256.1 hypothetical protein DQ237_10370 [Blastococcus sp. TF02-8]
MPTLLPAAGPRPDLRLAAAAAAALGLAFLVGFWNHEHARYAYVLACAPLLFVLALRPHVPLILGTGLLSLTALGTTVGAARLSASDALLAISFVGSLACLLLAPSWRERGRDLRLILLCAAAFCVWLGAVMLVHGSLPVVVNSLQTYQLFLVPLVTGAVVLEPRTGRSALLVLVIGSVVLSLMWIVSGGQGTLLTGNKNPDGQFLANALVVALALAPSWAWRLAALLPLGAGLVFTQSRGALLGAAVGIVVVLVFRGLGTWRRTLAGALALGALVLLGYRMLPADVVARSTDFSSGATGTALGDLTASQYTVQLRDVFADQGWDLVDAHPVFGVGPGNYRTGIPGQESFTVDPHNLLIRTAGDVGYPGLIAFGLLVVGTAFIAYRRRHVNPYAAVALAVQAAVITHGFVDVYWVRGTPILPWLLLGMAVNRRLDRPHG